MRFGEDIVKSQSRDVAFCVKMLWESNCQAFYVKERKVKDTEQFTKDYEEGGEEYWCITILGICCGKLEKN